MSQDLRSLVTTTNRLQEQLQDAVRRLEQRGGTEQLSRASTSNPSSSGASHTSRPMMHPQSYLTPLAVTERPPVSTSDINLPSSSTHLHSNSSSPMVQRQSSLSSLFNWNPSSLVGKKRKGSSSSRVKKKKLPTWTHTFVCLANVDQDTVPDGQERAELQIAGLGEKRITLTAYADAQEIYQDLTFQFPKLSESGGFELLRVPEGGKQLDVISSPESGYTVSYLRAVVHHAKVYIRPLQNSLSLEPLKEPVWCEPPKEKCLTCGDMVSVTALREHVVNCKQRHTRSKSDQSGGSVSDCGRVNSPILLDSPPGSPDFSVKSDDIDPVTEVALHLSKADNPECNNESVRRKSDSECDDVDPVVEVALHISKEDGQVGNLEPKSVGDVVRHLCTKLCEEGSFDMVVRRSRILSDALRRMERLTFDPKKKLNVIFVGEEGADTGGLTREFFRLVGYSMKSKYMEETGCFRHNAVAYQECVYSRLGTLAAMALVHGGSSFRLFSPCVYNFLCGMDAADLIAGIEEVPNCETREILKKIEGATSVSELREMLIENLELLMECGYNKPVSKAVLDDKVNIIQTVTLHKVVLASLAELSQFRSGLSTLGVDKVMKEHSHLLHSYYCDEYKDVLSSDSIRNMFTVVRFSDSGTTARIKEEETFMYFVDYLDDCERVGTPSLRRQNDDEEDEYAVAEEAAGNVTLKSILAFFTGADGIPPLGYSSAVLTFNPSNPYPTASTCAIQLTLPTKYTDYDEFKKHMDTAFTLHGGFGLI